MVQVLSNPDFHHAAERGIQRIVEAAKAPNGTAPDVVIMNMAFWYDMNTTSTQELGADPGTIPRPSWRENARRLSWARVAKGK